VPTTTSAVRNDVAIGNLHTVIIYTIGLNHSYQNKMNRQYKVPHMSHTSASRINYRCVKVSCYPFDVWSIFASHGFNIATLQNIDFN
jgi:hypothetical protein